MWTRTRIAVAGLAVALAACGGPPKVVKYTVKPAVIKALPAEALKQANQEHQAWLEAQERYKAEKARMRLRKLDYRLAKLWYKAAKLRVRRIKAALKLKAKKVEVDLPPGALSAALDELELAKKNLKYRKLLYKFERKRLKMFRWQAYMRKAQYMEEVVNALHRVHHKSADKYPRSKFARQSAKIKAKMADIQEKVERAEEEVRTLKQELQDWHPSLRCAPQPPAGQAAQPQAGQAAQPAQGQGK